MITNIPSYPSYLRVYVKEWWHKKAIPTFYWEKRRTLYRLLRWIQEKERIGYNYTEIEKIILEELKNG